jgi:tetratricopeptide (TPR) repeat protein
MTGSRRPMAFQDKESPYVGPRPFRQTEADRFFGRGRESRDVRSLWIAERLLILHGPAAVGKTSLLNAGVLPLLNDEANVDILPVGRVVRQAARPTATTQPYNRYSYTLLNSWALSERPPLPGTSITQFFREYPRQFDSHGEPRAILGAIDQFEDFFTAFPASNDERTGFIDELAEALREIAALRVIIVARDDFLPELSRYEQRIAPYRFTYVRLDALDINTANEAVEMPLALTDRSFAPGVAAELVDALRTTVYTDAIGETVTIKGERIEPLFLQVVCAELWFSLPSNIKVIRSQDLQAVGEIVQSIIHFYDAIIREVSVEADEAEGTIRSWLESTFITEHSTRGTAYRGIDMTAGMSNKVADALVARHFLVPERRALSTWYQLAQDKLISAIRDSNAKWRASHRDDPPGPALPAASADTYRAAAEEALGIGNYPSAHRFAQVAASGYRSIGDDRRLAHTLVLEGDIARSEGDLEAAQESLRAAVSTFDTLQDRYSTVHAMSALADVYLSAGDYSATEELQRQAVSLLPTDIDALIGLGYAQWYGGSPADADATFGQVLGRNPLIGRALVGRGQARIEMREYETGLKDLNTALEVGVNPTDETDCRSAIAVALAGMGQTAAAERELATALSRDPRRAWTHLRAAQVARTLGRSEDERRELKDALRGFPKLPAFAEARARRMLANLADDPGD